MAIYGWAAGSRCKKPAQEVGEYLENLRNTVGLTPTTLLEASKDEDAYLHDEFEWDDSRAAIKWRTKQAQDLICHIVVKVEEYSDPEPVRAFVRATPDHGEYTPIGIAIRQPDMQEVLLNQAKADMESFTRKYRSLEQISRTIHAIDADLELLKSGESA